MKIAILGATGATGSILVSKAVEGGHDVVAISRSARNLQSGTNIEVRTGDLTHVPFIKSAIGESDVVVSCLGLNRQTRNPWAKPTSPNDLLSSVSTSVIEAIEQMEKSLRFIYLSAYGVGPDYKKMPLIARLLVRRSNIWLAYRDHARSEKLISSSQLKWTIVKPPGLTDNTEDVPLTDRGMPKSSFANVSRRSLASFLLQCARDDLTVGKVLIPTRGNQ